MIRTAFFFIFIFSSRFLIPQDFGSWNSFDTLITPRQSHSAILLSNGNILVAGGNKVEDLSSCEMYDAKEKKWRITASLNYPRRHLQLIQLKDGRVLAISGENIKSCEIFDSVTEEWTLTDSVSTKRFSSKVNAILLDDGRVLVTGGVDLNNPGTVTKYLNICEIFDPNIDKWLVTDSLKNRRTSHTMTKLKDGRILVAGGSNKEVLYINQCEIFDPVTNIWTTVDSMNIARYAHTAILLSDGKVLIAGGENQTNPSDPWLSSCEVYDPDLDEWIVKDSLAVSRTDAQAFFVTDNLIMFVGGIINAQFWELFDVNKLKPVYIDVFPVNKLNQEIIITEVCNLISIGGTEVDFSGGMPYLFATNKCEIYKPDLTRIFEGGQTPKNFELNQNYPNPFNSNTIITYYLPTGSNVELTIYDLLGNKVDILDKGYKLSGFHKVDFNGAGLSSGVFIYNLRYDQYSSWKKMILLK